MSEQPAGFQRIGPPADLFATLKARKAATATKPTGSSSTDSSVAPKCDMCFGNEYIRNKEGRFEPCVCLQAKQAARMTATLVARSGITDQQAQKTLDSYDVAIQSTPAGREQAQKALSAARAFLAGRIRWLVMIGDAGIGKSHLGIAITNVLIAERKLVRYCNFFDWYDELSLMDFPGKVAAERELAMEPYVVIDEITGQDDARPARLETLRKLLVRRADRNLPTVILSNLPFSDFAGPLAARFTEYAGPDGVLLLSKMADVRPTIGRRYAMEVNQ